MSQEKENKFLWIPVLIASGIIFADKVIFLIFALFISLIIRNSNFIAFILFILLGVIAINVRFYSIDTHFINKPIYVHKGVGKVDEINYKTSYTQLILSDVKHFKLKNASKVRIKIYKMADNIQSGDYVVFSGKLTPPSLPVAPYAYNFAQFAYFDSISAVGFATAPIELHSHQHMSLLPKIDGLRNYIAKFFINIMGARNGNIAAALIVGKRQGIEKNIMEDIRKAGLAHLLAISGLHLTVVTFFFFFTFRKIFSLSLFLATRYNIKKWAAILGLIFSFFYLLISGMPISAQRAFIMVLIVLTAILIDRNSSTMRSIAVAAIVILLLEPESIFKPSFQMSFAAVIGLCSFYESYKRLYIHNIFYRMCGYFSSIALSSLVASFATTPYTIYHFNYFSLGGIFSNLIAIPLTTFIILPCGLMATLLMPLGKIPGLIMSYGISLLINLSHKIGNMPYSSLPVHTFDNLSILIITLGFLWLCLWQQKWRLFGIPIILLGLVIGLSYKTPNVLINEKMVAIKGGDNNLYFLTKQRKNFVNKTWIAQNGQSKIYTKHSNDDKVSITCNKDYCRYYSKGKSVIFLYSLPEEVKFEDFDYVIQLRKFPTEGMKNLIPFEEVKKGYFLWI